MLTQFPTKLQPPGSPAQRTAARRPDAICCGSDRRPQRSRVVATARNPQVPQPRPHAWVREEGL